MISRTVIGKSFRGVVRYQFSGRRDAPSDKQPEVLVAVGVRETSADEMLEDFNRRRRQNADLGNAVWHTTLSFNPADAARLDSAQMLLIAERWVQEMKLDQTQYVIIRHHDQPDNQHIHIVANRVDDAGQTISDKYNFFAARRVNQLLEAEFALTPARGSSQPELQHPERIEGPDRARAEIRQAIGRALAAGVTERGELLEILRTQHITAREFTTKAGVVTGISFAKDDHTFKGSEIARDYGLAGLEKQLARNREVQAAQQREAALVAEQQAEAQRQEAARLAEQQAQTTARRREAARQETQADLTRTRDSGLSYPAQFFYRLRAQPYDLVRDAQTQQLTHVRHHGSGELFTWAEVQPGGPGAPPLADQLAAAVQHTHQQTVVRQQAAAARDWAQGRTQVEQVTTQVRADQAFYNRADLSAQLQRAGVTLLPSSPGYAELFRLEATGQIFREREVLRGGSVADLLAEAAPRQAARRQLVQEQTSQATEQTLYAPKTPLTDLADYQRQLEAEGYKVWRVPGKGVEIEHLASGERFPFQQVRPGGPGAASLNDQLRAILARQQQPPVTPVQATEMLAQVLKVRPLTSELRYEAHVQQQGYQFVWGLDGQARLLHEASSQHFALAELRPNGRALAPQVSEAIAASRAETVQGRIEVVLADPQLASRWEANMQAELRALGATGEVLPLSTPGVGGQVALQYTHPTHGPQLEALNQWLRTLQDIKGVTLYEQNQGFDQPLASWPPRRGEYAQATVVLEATATRTAQARSEAARPYLLATGASVREVASSAAGTHTLEVRYHTARTEVGKLTTLLDKWQEQLPGLQVHETDRAREVRGSRLPPPERVVELTRG